ncbi:MULTISPECIES: hypothetical protein [unclassified Wolbachia]|uniref:hypothetical protein n=1 Tax=unclassified Wolbachia TaxID=2640676 RepID=UPI0021F8164E|nr:MULTISPECIES: hypothetical protein [unclassified Wolbachia]MDX5508056.1 hypothetical protein [Wolbachia endosymbiont of Hylaeus sinuatus]
MAKAGKGAKLNIGKIATIVADVSKNASLLLPIILFFLDFMGFNFFIFPFSFLKPFLNTLPLFSSFSTGFVFKLFIFSFIPFLSFFALEVTFEYRLGFTTISESGFGLLFEILASCPSVCFLGETMFFKPFFALWYNFFSLLGIFM